MNLDCFLGIQVVMKNDLLIGEIVSYWNKILREVVEFFFKNKKDFNFFLQFRCDMVLGRKLDWMVFQILVQFIDFIIMMILVIKSIVLWWESLQRLYVFFSLLIILYKYFIQIIILIYDFFLNVSQN